MEINFLYGKKDLQMNMPSWFSYNYSDTNAEHTALRQNIFWTKKSSGLATK